MIDENLFPFYTSVMHHVHAPICMWCKGEGVTYSAYCTQLSRAIESIMHDN